VVFWLVRLQGAWPVFWVVYLVTLSTGIVLAYFIAALSPNMDVANAALPSYVVTLLFFAGFLLRWSQIPKWWQWYAYLDFLRYAWGALMKNQFHGDRNVAFITNDDGSQITILDYYSLGGINMWGWVGIELCFTVFFFFCALATLKFVKHIKR
jgi:hypothetical protein